MGRLIAAAPGIIPLPEIDSSEPNYGEGWIVTVFNNEYNTYDEVMYVLMVATGCDHEEAYMETWEIDHLGKSVVHHGAEQDCRDAAEIIATIGIRVTVTQE